MQFSPLRVKILTIKYIATPGSEFGGTFQEGFDDTCSDYHPSTLYLSATEALKTDVRPRTLRRIARF